MARPWQVRPKMKQLFGMQLLHISSIISMFLEATYQVAHPYLSDPSFFHEQMPYYASLIKEKFNHAVSNAWGFIDGTIRRTCRQSFFQRLAFSGHKRFHGIKFQSVVVPEGLIA